jgi:dihydroorotate dehydrogenase (NAD+) catalytic subunit
MGMSKLQIELCGLKLKTPIIMASGIFGYGEEKIDFLDYAELGAVVSKTITLEPRKGNPQPRLYETQAGLINSIGLQNPGVKEFVRRKLPRFKKMKVKIIVSITGQNIEELRKIINLLPQKEIDAVELNLSCPNVDRNRLMISQKSDSTRRVVKEVKKFCSVPLIVKLSPNVTDIGIIAAAAENSGADALTLINTVGGLGIDIKNKTVIEGGLSGPAIKHVGLKAVYRTFSRVSIPIIGTGGITRGKDAVEYLLAGAAAVGIGSGFFSNPLIIEECCRALNSFISKGQYKNISAITGLLNEQGKK